MPRVTRPGFVFTATDVRESLNTFNREALSNLARATNLLSTTTYWVLDPDTDRFGPGKFVGLRGVPLRDYSEARIGVTGSETQQAIQKVLGKAFKQRPEWHSRLRAWGRALVGASAFGHADERKWRFVSLADEPALALTFGSRYGRREIFASVGERYSQQDQNKNTGLSPRCPDGGYFLFITLNKTNFDPAYDYADELGLGWFRWTTRRDRGENHPDYVRLRDAQTRVSLFVRKRERENFAYLGELRYLTHRQFREERRDKIQQEYLFELRWPIPEELYVELVVDMADSDAPIGNSEIASDGATTNRARRAATLTALKTAASYALGRLERTIVPAHHNYQVRLKQFLDSKTVSSEWERDFVDVRFELNGWTYLGEIKVTTTLRLEEAFRAALGQLLEYGFIRFNTPPRMIMFLDKRLDPRRTALATHLGISVVCELNDGYTLLNPEVSPALTALFPNSQ